MGATGGRPRLSPAPESPRQPTPLTPVLWRDSPQTSLDDQDFGVCPAPTGFFFSIKKKIHPMLSLTRHMDPGLGHGPTRARMPDVAASLFAEVAATGGPFLFYFVLLFTQKMHEKKWRLVVCLFWIVGALRVTYTTAYPKRRSRRRPALPVIVGTPTRRLKEWPKLQASSVIPFTVTWVVVACAWVKPASHRAEHVCEKVIFPPAVRRPVAGCEHTARRRSHSVSPLLVARPDCLTCPACLLCVF